MQIAQVIGRATATVKHPSLIGAVLLLVQPLMRDGHSCDGDPQLVIDTMAAGRGDVVVISSDGAMLRELLSNDQTPARYSTIGFIDSLLNQ